MQKKSAGSENLIRVGGSIKDGAAKIWGQFGVGLLCNFENRILGGWLSDLQQRIVVFGCFVDIKEGLAGGGVGFV